MTRRQRTKGEKRQRGTHDPLAKRLARFRDVLDAIGCREPFDAMTPAAQRVTARLKTPDPQVVFAYDPRLHEPPKASREERAFRDEIERLIRETRYEVRDGGPTIAVRDFTTVVFDLARVATHMPRDRATPDVAAFLDAVLPEATRLLRDQLPAAMSHLYHHVAAEMAKRTRIDGHQIVTKFEHLSDRPGDARSVFTFRTVPCETVRVTVDGKDRRAFPVRWDDTQGGTKRLAWKPADVGIRPTKDQRPDVARPVVVQGHALKQMRRRLDLPEAAPYLDAWLVQNLREPTVVERHGDDLLVAFKLVDKRLGYLWVTPTQDHFVVRTFLFLTMAPSPEFRRLEQRLGLSRHDADYLRLTELGPFVTTDLRQDQRLRRAFRACGCGQLFELEDDCYALHPEPYAADVHHYLRPAA